MVSSVNYHTNAARIGWHLWEIDLRFAPGLLPGWKGIFWPILGENRLGYPPFRNAAESTISQHCLLPAASTKPLGTLNPFDGTLCVRLFGLTNLVKPVSFPLHS